MNALGATLRAQRTDLSLSVGDLASLANLDAVRVGEIEEGAAPSTSEVGRLARALAVDPAALWRGDVPSTRTTARFRSVDGLAPLGREDATLMARAAEAGRIAGHLLGLLGRPSKVAAARHVCSVEGWPEPWDQGYRLGARARQALYPERHPIVSMIGLLESWGVHVAFVTFAAPKLLAASLYEPGAAPVILLNASAPRVQAPLSRRAVLAHELCHLLHDGGESDLLTLISRTHDVQPHEQRANGFAPSFLVPGGWLSPHTTDSRALVGAVAREWGLSFEGAAWHVKNAGHIPNAEAETLRKEPDSIAPGHFEPVPSRQATASLDVLEPSSLVVGLLSDLVIEAESRELVTRRRAQEILRLA